MINSNSPSCFLGSSFRGPSVPLHLLSNSIPPAFPTESPLLPASSSSSLYPSFLSGSVFRNYPSSSALFQDSGRYDAASFSPRREEDRTERIVSTTGKLIHQHLSPEELRWKHYEPLYINAFDPNSSFTRRNPQDLEQHHAAHDSAGQSLSSPIEGSMSEGIGKMSAGGSKSQIEPADCSEAAAALAATAAQTHPGPSLKMAASALAEMLALGSADGTSAAQEGRLPSDSAFGGGEGGEPGSERVAEDYCSSTESARKEGNGASFRDQFGEFTGGGFGPDLMSSRPGTGGALGIGGLLPEESLIDRPGAIPTCALSATDSRAAMASGDAAESHGILDAEGSSSSKTSTAAAFFNNLFPISGVSNSLSTAPAPVGNLSSVSQAWRLGGPASSQAAGGASSAEGSASEASPFAPKITISSGLPLFGPHHDVPSSTELRSQLPLDASHDDQWRFMSTSCGSSLPLSQAYLDPQGSISVQTTEAASRILANLKCGCPESSSQPEPALPGTGLHSLTASISNLSKVLFALDSPALTRPDSAALENTLQSSILRLSECLLLEQSRACRNSSSRFVGSDEPSSGRKPESPDVPLVDLDLRHHIEPSGRRASLGRLKGPEAGVLAGAGRSSVGSARLRSASRSKLTSADQDKGKLKVINHSFGPSAGHLKGAVPGDVMELLKEKGILNRSSVERLLGAEARETRLKATVEELREELEMERAENRGTAYLCDKILEEGGPRQRAVLSGPQKGLSKVTTDGLIYDPQAWRTSPENISDGEGSCKPKSVGATAGLSARKRRDGTEDKGCCTESNAEFGSPLLAKSSQAPLLNSIDQMKVHLGVIQARLAAGSNLNTISDDAASRSGPRQGKDVAAAREHISEPLPGLNLGGHDTRGRWPDASEFLNESIEARLALMNARNERGIPSEALANVEAKPRTTGSQLSPEAGFRNVSRRAAVGTAMTGTGNTISDGNSFEPRAQPFQARPTLLRAQSEATIDSRRARDMLGDATEVFSQPSVSGRTSSSVNGAMKDDIDARLALLQARAGWDNELGVFTETEPCTPAHSTTLGIGNGVDQNGHAAVDIHEERAASAPKSPDARPLSSDAASTLYATWDQLSEQVKSTHLDAQFSTDLELEVESTNLDAQFSTDSEHETDMDSPVPSTQPYGDRHNDVEARARLIRSRPDWNEGEESHSDDEDLLGRPLCKASSSTSTHGVSCDADRFETLREISLVRLLDSDVGASDSFAETSTTVLTGLAGGPSAETPHTGKGSPGKDLEEDSSWEHVGFPSI